MTLPCLKKALVTAGALAAFACATGCSNRDATDEDLMVDAQFVSFVRTNGSTFRSGGSSCGSRLEIDAAGHVTDGQATGTLSPKDTQRFAALALGVDFIDALRSGQDCYPG